MRIAPRWYPLKALEGMRSIGGKLRITARLAGVEDLVIEERREAERAEAERLKKELGQEEGDENDSGAAAAWRRQTRPFDLARVQQNTLSDPAALLGEQSRASERVPRRMGEKRKQRYSQKLDTRHTDIDTTKIPFLSPTRNKYTFTEMFAPGGAGVTEGEEGTEKAGGIGEPEVQSEEELQRRRAEAEAIARAEEFERERQHALKEERQRLRADRKAARRGTRLALSQYRDGEVEDAFQTAVNLPADGVHGVSRLLHLASPGCLCKLVGKGTQADPDPLLGGLFAKIAQIILELLILERFAVLCPTSESKASGEDVDSSSWERYFEESESEEEADDDDDDDDDDGGGIGCGGGGGLNPEPRPVYEGLGICKVMTWVKHAVDLGLVLQASESAVSDLTHAMAALARVDSNKLQDHDELRDAPLIYALLSSPCLLRAHCTLAMT